MSFLNLTGKHFENRKEFEDYLEAETDVSKIKGGLNVVCALSDFKNEG